MHGDKSLLDNLDSYEATGPDNVPAHLLKLFSSELAPVLTMIFQTSLHQSHIPTNWKTANIIPVHKKGNHSVPNNYCPTVYH